MSYLWYIASFMMSKKKPLASPSTPSIDLVFRTPTFLTCFFGTNRSTTDALVSCNRLQSFHLPHCKPGNLLSASESRTRKQWRFTDAGFPTEWAEDYRPGRFHQVHSGHTFKTGRYRIITRGCALSPISSVLQ